MPLMMNDITTIAIAVTPNAIRTSRRMRCPFLRMIGNRQRLKCRSTLHIVAHASASRAKSRVVCHSWHYYHRNVSTCGLHEQPRAPTRARTAWCVPQPDDGTKPASCDVTVVDYRSNSAEGGSAPLGFVRVLQHALTLGDDVGSVVPSVRLPVHVAFQVLVRVHTLLVHQTRKHTFSTRNDAHRGITNRTLCQARVVP